MISEKKEPHRLILDGRRLNENPAAAHRGLGCIAANCRLLADYKYKHPAVYKEILRLLFEPGYGAGLSHIKVILGADLPSPAGIEPCAKRTPEEPADVTGCPGFLIAADARKINPALTVGLLRYGEPRWVTKAFSESRKAGFAARYRWYSEALKAAYQTLGLTFDFISPDISEPEKPDKDWILYFVQRLHHEPEAAYDYSAIRITVSGEPGNSGIAGEMIEDPDLLDAVDVIGLHHTTYGDKNTRFLHDVCGKEIWYSEGIAPYSIPSLSCRVDGTGLSSTNGVLDTANRIINSYAHSRMVMYAFLPVIGGSFDTSPLYPSRLITADTPWSGHYSLDAGFWAAAHFTRFSETGWQHFDAACFGDGEENQAVWNTTHNYITLASPDKRYVTAHFCNDSGKTRVYKLVFRNLPGLAEDFSSVETIGSADPKKNGEKWFYLRGTMHPAVLNDERCMIVRVRPHSLLTVTNMEIRGLIQPTKIPVEMPSRRLPLPFSMPTGTHSPLYAAGSTFVPENGRLVQIITEKNMPIQQNYWKMPVISFGDDSWANYQGSAVVQLASKAKDNFAGVGIRDNGTGGLVLRLYGDGKWTLRYMEEILEGGILSDFDINAPHRLTVVGMGTLFLAICDNKTLCEKQMAGIPLIRSGRMCLQSGWYQNTFSDIKAVPIPMTLPLYCHRADCLSPLVSYPEDAENGWMLDATAEESFFNRTCAAGTKGSIMEFRFFGSGIFLLGKTQKAAISLYLDGKLYSPRREIPASHCREAFCTIDALRSGWHSVRMEILDGTLELNALEIPTNSQDADYPPADTPKDPFAHKNKPSGASAEGGWKKTAVLSLAAGAAAAAVAAGILKKGKK